MKKIISLLVFVSFASVMFYAGCKDTISGLEIDKRPIPTSNVSYSANLQPVLNVKCATSGCHDDISRAGGISFTTWANTTADPNVVFPGKPENSSLVWAIEGNPAVSPMPPPGYPSYVFTSAQIQGVKTWIKEGAKNN